MSTFYSAREKFELAKNSSRDQATATIAEGLMDLSRAIENELRSVERKLEQELHTIKNRVNSIRT